MKMRVKTKILSIVLTTIFVFLFVSCADSEAIKAGNASDSKEADCIINGKKLYFVSDEEKQQWIEPLTKLIANEKSIPIVDEDSIMGYLPPDSDSPSIEKFHECGLLDVTGDGIPELLVRPWGWFGSSGTTGYYIYDIYTGQMLGQIEGGNGGTWCAYYCMETDKILFVNQYWLRGGWAYRERFLSAIEYSEEKGYIDRVYLYASYVIDGETQNIIDEDPDDGIYQAEWIETYPETHYRIFGQEVYLDDYYDCIDRFNEQYVRIPETKLVIISWNDYSDEERAESARRMAEALVSSGQAFIKTGK